MLPEEDCGLGIVDEIRWSGAQRHAYSYTISSINPDNDITGGIYGKDQLAATGRRAPLEHFWTEPHLARQIVRVSE